MCVLALLAAVPAGGCRSAQPSAAPVEEKTTILVQRWPNGMRMTRREVLAGVRRSDGPESGRTEPVDHGIFAQWFADGTLQYIGRYRHGKLHGMELEWHDNGGKAVMGRFEDGKRQGLRRAWSPAGQLVVEERYLDDLPHGTWSIWEPSGRLKWQGQFDRGQPQP